MGRYQKGDHVKVEVSDDRFGASEWMWMLVDHSDDEQRLVFGELDNEPRREHRYEARTAVGGQL